MKNLSILILILGLASCSVKSTSSKTSSSTSNPSTTNPGDTGGGGSGGGGGGSGGDGVTSCDGVARSGATLCYYKNIPTIIASGGTYGQTWWSSSQFITDSGNSPSQFSTDATFNVRIIPRSSTASTTSTFGKSCSTYMTYATKLQVQLMLRKNGTSLGEVATLDAAINSASKVWRFTVPATSEPLILEVVNVLSDSRCTGFYGSKPSGCSTNPYKDIPINQKGPTECVAFDIQYSTDETYDLPGSSAN